MRWLLALFLITTFLRAKAEDASEQPVVRDASLEYFSRHQEEDGSWNETTFTSRCAIKPMCGQLSEPVPAVATTALATLCFLGCGYDHRMPSKYQKLVRKALDRLTSWQANDGNFSRDTAIHAVVAVAILEAYAMSQDAALRQPAELAAAIISQRQDTFADGSLGGWCSADDNDHFDSWTSCWCVMALKSAQAAGLDVAKNRQGAKHWFELAWKSANPDRITLQGPGSQSRFPTSVAKSDGVAPSKDDLSAAGAVAAIFLDYKSQTVELRTLCERVWNENRFNKDKGIYDSWVEWQNTLAFFQSDLHWQEFQTDHRTRLLEAQSKAGCEDGSWAPDGSKHGGFTGGRLATSAMSVLALQIYYRYLPPPEKAEEQK